MPRNQKMFAVDRMMSEPTRRLLTNLQADLSQKAAREKPPAPSTVLESLLDSVVPRIGIGRIAEIGHFISSGVHVYQTTRPQIYYNFRSGMNTGSQGKGLTREQAIISSIMEALEAYCMEPREFLPVTCTSRELAKNHRVMTPTGLGSGPNVSSFTADTEILWTRALLWPDQVEVSIPAEIMYCIFPKHYGVEGHFTASSNGIGAHSSSAGALLQGLYEVLERFYLYHFERKNVEVEAFILEESRVARLFENCPDEFLEQFDVQLYSMRVKGLAEQLPFVYCVICDETRMSEGFGMHLNPIKALERAYTEAAQCMTTEVSASREDLANIKGRESAPPEPAAGDDSWPEYRTLKYSTWAKRFGSFSVSQLGAQFEYIVSWLKKMDCPQILIRDLTPSGVTFPVVKVFVPGLPLEDKYCKNVPGSMSRIPHLKSYNVHY